MSPLPESSIVPLRITVPCSWIDDVTITSLRTGGKLKTTSPAVDANDQPDEVEIGVTRTAVEPDAPATAVNRAVNATNVSSPGQSPSASNQAIRTN